MKITVPFFLAFAAAASLTGLGATAQVLSPAFDHAVHSVPFDPVAPLVPSDAAAGSAFGSDVSLSGDRAAIAAVGAAPFGAVYVFEKHGNTWVQAARVESGEPVDDAFGSSVSISGDRMVVGAWRSAYVFTRQHGTWIRTARLASPEGVLDDGFGAEVAIDGNRIVVGAPNAMDQWDIVAGAAFVFEGNGRVWLHTARLDHPGGGYGGDRFGESLALQGDSLIAGASLAKVGGHDHGQAWAFARLGSQWNAVADFTSTADTAAFLEMGIAVALDGNVAVVGAPGDGPGLGWDVPGAAYVYRRLAGDWKLEAKLAADDELFEAVRFGSNVAVHGSTVLVSASQGSAGGATAGSVYVFEKTRVGWVQTDEWAVEFGGQIALESDVALVGTASADVAGTNSGSAAIRALDGLVPPLASSPSWVQFWQDVPGGGLSNGFDGSHQRLLLDATPMNGGQPFVVLGSMSGTAPGTRIDAFLVPLVEDAYFLDTLNDPSSTPLVGSTGVLDTMGRAACRFAVPPGGFDQDLVGTTFHHAFVVLDPAAQTVVFASNAAPVTLCY